jgi:transposase-like protein
MPKLSLQKKKEADKLKLKAFLLYKQGYSLRAVGEKVGKSYQWVHNSVREVSVVNN